LPGCPLPTRNYITNLSFAAVESWPPSVTESVSLQQGRTTADEHVTSSARASAKQSYEQASGHSGALNTSPNTWTPQGAGKRNVQYGSSNQASPNR